jgi:uncharacterized coiled-coil protein SlyX
MSVQCLILEELEARTSEFEQLLEKIATAIATGVFSEKLPPSKLLEKTENYINRLLELATNNQESMLLLKPEKTLTIKARYEKLSQTLTTFKGILLQNTSDPVANSRLAFEQLRKALTDGSDFLFLTREIRDNPSPLIRRVLGFKELAKTSSSRVSVRTSQDAQPLINYVLKYVEELNTQLTELENRIREFKQSVRELQEGSMNILSDKAEEPPGHGENKTEKRQLSLSNFKAEQN